MANYISLESSFNVKLGKNDSLYSPVANLLHIITRILVFRIESVSKHNYSLVPNGLVTFEKPTHCQIYCNIQEGITNSYSTKRR